MKEQTFNRAPVREAEPGHSERQEQAQPPRSLAAPPFDENVLLAAIIESTDDAIISKNLNSIITSWNPAAEHIFGYSEEEAVGNSILMLIPPEIRSEEDTILSRLRRGERIDHFETVRVRKDGRRINVSITVSPIRDRSGKVIGASKIARDITEQKRNREELLRVQEQLQDHARKLEEAVEHRTSELQSAIAELEGFSYSLAHDMRAPLRAIHSFSQIVISDARDRLGAENVALLEKTIKAAGRLDRLIQDVLTYSRVTREPLKLHRTDLGALLRQIIDERPEFQEPHSEVIVEGDFHSVCAHEAYVTQILTNLLSNAVKFVKPDAKPKVRIHSEKIGDNVRVCVEDDGIGIPEAAQERIYGMFQRMHDEKTYPGTGIGLAIVRKAVQRMRGTMGVQSELGKGSRFWFELPSAD